MTVQETSTITLPDGLRDLMASEENHWPARQASIPAWHPRMEETPEEKAERERLEAEAAAKDDDEGDDDEGKTFDATYVKRLREEAAKYRTRASAAEAKVQEHEDASKDEKTKSAEQLASAQERAAYADKLDVALDKAPEGMSVAQVRKLAKRLTGKTRDELEQDAEELFSDFAPSKGDEDDETPRRQPRERLRPGAAPSSEPEETDPRKLAEMVPRR